MNVTSEYVLGRQCVFNGESLAEIPLRLKPIQPGLVGVAKSTLWVVGGRVHVQVPRPQSERAL